MAEPKPQVPEDPDPFGPQPAPQPTPQPSGPQVPEDPDPFEK